MLGLNNLPSEKVLKAWKEMLVFLQEFVENNFGQVFLIVICVLFSFFSVVAFWIFIITVHLIFYPGCAAPHCTRTNLLGKAHQRRARVVRPWTALRVLHWPRLQLLQSVVFRPGTGVVNLEYPRVQSLWSVVWLHHDVDTFDVFAGSRGVLSAPGARQGKCIFCYFSVCISVFFSTLYDVV